LDEPAPEVQRELGEGAQKGDNCAWYQLQFLLPKNQGIIRTRKMDCITNTIRPKNVMS